MKVKLTGAGYRENAILGKKFNVLYRLCEEQLSKQAHYDFGLRNILAVLRTAGASKRNDLSASESMLLMRTLRDMNLSKFVAEDVVSPPSSFPLDEPLHHAPCQAQLPRLVLLALRHPIPECSWPLVLVCV